MSHLPVPSRLKAPASRIAKAPSAKSDVSPRSGLKAPAIETPQKAALKQPAAAIKRTNSGDLDNIKVERKSIGLGGTGASAITPRGKQTTTQSKLTKTSGLQQQQQQTPVHKREAGLQSGINKRASTSSSTSSLNIKEQQVETPPTLARERTQESIKDAETGILFKIGDRVLVAGTKAGVIEYLGETQFAKGLWAGVKLDEATGKNNGCVSGVKYFDCEELHGVFSKVNRLHKINIVPEKKASLSDFNSSKQLEESNVLKIGDTVIVSGTKVGTLRYLGPTEFAKGEWAGVELKEPLGKNDGAVAGTRYFTCEPKYGLFAPAAKVTKSKRQPLHPKVQAVFSPELPSLADAAKSVFKKTSPQATDVPSSPAKEKQAVVPEVDRTTSPDESHATLKKPSTAPQQVAALQSALEEREREIRKMLMERELEKAEKLRVLEEENKPGEGVLQNDQVVKEKEDLIHTLRNEVDKLKSENSNIQMKLDEEIKKYEDLQFMLEEEKITDDELKHHVKEDEGKIKELSEQANEKSKKIIALQRELQESRAENISNEAKILELSDQLTDSKAMVTEIKNSMSSLSGSSEDAQGRLAIATAELNESREEVRRKSELIDDLERKVTEQVKLQNEEAKRAMDEMISSSESEKRAVLEECREMRSAKDEVDREVNKLKHEKKEMEDKLKSTSEKLESLEKQYKDMSETNALAAKKDEAAKAATLGLNATILDLKDQLSQSKSRIVDLENDMAQVAVTFEEKNKQLETALRNTKKEIEDQKEVVNQKTKMVVEMENQLKEQILRQKEIEKNVEHLGQADKNLALMKEAHRSEIETLQSKINSLNENVVNLEKKQQDLLSDHQTEMKEAEATRSEQMEKLNEKISSLQSAKNAAISECESLKSENGKIVADLSRLQSEYEELKGSKQVICEKVEDLQKRCNELSETNQQLSAERNDVIQLCEDQDQQLDLLKKEKDGAFLERDSLSKERDELSQKIGSLETQIKTLHSESSMKQGELQQAKETEIKVLNAKLEELMREKATSNDSVGNLQARRTSLENDLETKASEINKLKSEQQMLLDQSHSLEGQVNDLKRAMMEENERARKRVIGLENEISVLKDDVDEAQCLVKSRDGDIETYKEQVGGVNGGNYDKFDIEKLKGESIPKSPMDGDILENASTLLIRLHEAESKLSVLQSDKETAEEQVDFLNSVIVDLQTKNEKANQTIALLEAGDDAVMLHGLDSESDEETLGKPKFTLRKFCDICDVFDQHDTDECPLQAGSADDSGGVQNHGDRLAERPYCGICESFGHWSEDCDDEQTF